MHTPTSNPHCHSPSPPRSTKRNRDKLLSLHRTIRPGLARRRRKETYIHIIILHQLLQRGHNLIADQLLALLRSREGSLVVLFQRDDGSVGGGVGEALEDVDEDGVGFGDVEADVGDLVGDEGGEDGEDGVGEDGEGEGWGEGLELNVSKLYWGMRFQMGWRRTETAKQVVIR